MTDFIDDVYNAVDSISKNFDMFQSLVKTNEAVLVSFNTGFPSFPITVWIGWDMEETSYLALFLTGTKMDEDQSVEHFGTSQEVIDNLHILLTKANEFKFPEQFHCYLGVTEEK